jgi:hypothetical protein
MAKIFKSSILDTSRKIPEPRKTIYQIVGDKPVEENDEDTPSDLAQVPYGSVSLKHSPAQFRDIFAPTPQRDSVSKITGLKQRYLERTQDKTYNEWASEDRSFDGEDELFDKHEAIGDFIEKANRFDNNYFGEPPKRNASNLQSRREAGIGLAKSYNTLRNEYPDTLHPETLFDITPAETVVDEMFIHPALRTSGPIVLADAHKNFGDLTASNDLSGYSSRLAQHAQDAGLPVKAHSMNTDFHQTNSISDESPTVYASYAEKLAQPSDEKFNSRRQMTSDEIKGAKEHLRSLTGRSKKVNMSSQFDHPTLFD